MQKYAYVALNQDGKTIKGTMIAQSDEEIKQLVAKNGLYMVSYDKLRDDSKGSKPLPMKSLVAFCTQLSSILKAGLPLASALEMLYGKMEKGALKKIVGNVYELVQKGNALSDAMIKQGRAFPPMMLNMVRAGEMSGEMDTSLKKLADHFDKDMKMKNQVKSALRYPKILIVITVLVVVVMVGFVVPSLLESMPMENLPSSTKLLIGLSDLVKGYWPILIVLVIFLYVGVPIIFNIPKIRFGLDKLKCKLPKIGKLVGMIYTSRFASSLATLYDGGIDLIEAMTMCTAIIGNSYVAEMMDDAIYRIKKGDSISKAMSSVTVFDPLLISMIFVGEESGVLGEVLGQVAGYFDEESSIAVKGLVDMLQPVMLMVMAVIVGYILLAVMTPMYSMYDSIG